jgi:mycoredoxin
MVTMYSTEWCGHCRRLKRQLDGAGISYREVDVDLERRYGDRIVEATGGYRVVPTVEVGEELLVNPTIDEVQAALA